MRFAALLPLLLVVSGCSTNKPQVEVDNSIVYKLVAVAQTELSKDGDTCGDATGTIRLYEHGVYGSAVDTFGQGYKITGKVDENGVLSGGFALSIITAVDFEGKLSSDKKHASGTWVDFYECEGTWKATKVQ